MELKNLILFLALLPFLGAIPTMEAGDLKYRERWTIQKGGEYSETGKSIALDREGNLYTAGITNSSLDGRDRDFFLDDIFLMKYGCSGGKKWIKQFGGTTDSKEVNDIAIDADGNIFFTGYAYGNLDEQFNSGERDIFLTKFDENGTRIWTKLYGGPEWDEGKFLTVGRNGGVYVAGTTENSLDSHENGGYEDIFLTAYDDTGRRRWTVLTGGEHFDDVWGLENDGAGSLYLVGEVDYEIFLARFTSDGEKVWSRKFDKSDIGLCCYDFGKGTIDSGGNFLLTGTTYLDENGEIGEYRDIVLAKFSNDGTYLWSKRFGSPYNDEVHDIVVDRNGAIYITGYSDGNLDGLQNTHEGTKDIFVTKFDINGEVIGTKFYGSEKDDEGYSLAVRENDIFVTGYTDGDLTIGYRNAGYSDIFITKFSSEMNTVSSGIDFNGDGIDDLLIRHSNGNSYTLLLKSDGSLKNYSFVANIPSSEWRVEGMGDFNGDGITDILVRNIADGATYSWIMKYDGTRESYHYITTIPETEWKIEGTESDFNGDGINDIVVRNKLFGWTYIWMMGNSGTRKNYHNITTIPFDQWEIVEVDGDFNNDGISDLIVRKREEGWTYVWLMNSDGSRDRYKFITSIPASRWEIAGADSDFNGDGVNDIVVRNKMDGSLWIWMMSADGNRKIYRKITKIPYERWDILGTDCEFDRNDTSDLVVLDKEDGRLYIWFMNPDGSRDKFRQVTTIPTDHWKIIQIKADLNRDGTSDFILHDLYSGTLYSWIMNMDGTKYSAKPIVTIDPEEWTVEKNRYTAK